MQEETYSFGMIGLGTMGRSLLLNMADHNFRVAGYDKDEEKVNLLHSEGEGKPVNGFGTLEEFVKSIQIPRSIMMLVPAGKIVDNVIEDLLPLLEKGDLIIDGGNSHFTDTNRRSIYLQDKGLHFFGMGVSGGEEGARRGPSMMPGGDKAAYQHVAPIFEAIAARVNGEPCVAYIGPGASGHFVKMVHNGIEYGLMQLIAETYGLLKDGLQLSKDEIQRVFAQWNDGRLRSFLMEITKEIFLFKKEGTDELLLDDIKDEARAKGTGKWTSQAAMDLELPATVIDTAVSLRDLSKYKKLRVQLSTTLGTGEGNMTATDKGQYLLQLEQAFYFAMITAYAQGMHMLSKASSEFKYELNLAEIAKIWRGGCIIRSEFLETIFRAFSKDDQLAHLFLDQEVGSLLMETQEGIRAIVSGAVSAGLAVPAYAASISYFDAIRTGELPSNLIQAQRDFFGAHTYELKGKEGFFHTEWVPAAD